MKLYSCYITITSNSHLLKSQNPVPHGTRIKSCYIYIYLNATLILLRLFQKHYRYNVTGQSHKSEGNYKPARIKEVHSKLHSFQALLCTPTATHLTLIYVSTYIRLSVPLGYLIKQAEIIIRTYNPKFEGNTGNRTRDLWLDKCRVYTHQQLYYLSHSTTKISGLLLAKTFFGAAGKVVIF